MKTWLARATLPFWMGLYYFLAHVVVAVLVVRFGVLQAAVIIFFVIGVWGCMFYFLLCIEGSLGQLHRQITRLIERRNRGLGKKLRKWFCADSEELLLSWGWVLIVFALFGTLAGVLTVRLGRTGRPAVKDLLLIWIGCLFSGIGTTVIIYGPLMVVARGLIAFIWGG